jgi:hypothetical protein
VYASSLFVGSVHDQVYWIVGASSGVGEYLAYEVEVKYLELYIWYKTYTIIIIF